MTDADDFNPTRDLSLVMDARRLRELLADLADPELQTVVLDLETTGLAPRSYRGGPLNGGVAAAVVLAAITLPPVEGSIHPRTYAIPLYHPHSPWQGRWRGVLKKIMCTIRGNTWVGLVNHNVKFDAGYVYATTGVDVSAKIVWDTAVAGHLQDENRSNRLKDLVPTIFGVPRWDDVDLTYPGAALDAVLVDLALYAARDTYWTYRLYRHQVAELYQDPDADPGEGPETSDEIVSARLGSLATWCAMPTASSLTAIEQRGMRLDLEWVRERIETEELTRDGAYAALVAMYAEVAHPETGTTLDADDASFAPTSIWFQRWADLAVLAGDLRVERLTPGGKAQWSKAVLGRQAAAGSVAAEQLLTYRGAVKRLEYLRSWLDYRSPVTSRVHPRYNLGSVVTGRLSSSEPNAQQITSALKPAFVPGPGRVIIEADYSQIELRVAAYISRCAPMLDAFRRGDDLHRLLAARISGKAPEDVTKAERQKGKSANFGLLYGMGAVGFQAYAQDAYGVVMTPDEAALIHATYFEMWDGLRGWHARAIRNAYQDGEVRSPIGRVRRLPNIYSADPGTAARAERAAINSPVQGFASDCMQIAAASIQGRLPASVPVRGAEIIATIHDSIVIEAPADDWQRVRDECVERMTVQVPEVLERLGCIFDVPLVVDTTTGTRWGTGDIDS